MKPSDQIGKMYLLNLEKYKKINTDIDELHYLIYLIIKYLDEQYEQQHEKRKDNDILMKIKLENIAAKLKEDKPLIWTQHT